MATKFEEAKQREADARAAREAAEREEAEAKLADQKANAAEAAADQAPALGDASAQSWESAADTPATGAGHSTAEVEDASRRAAGESVFNKSFGAPATPESPPASTSTTTAGNFDTRLQHEKQTLDPALADVRNEATASVNTAPEGGFDAPVAGAGPFHTPDPEGAVDAAAGTTKILPADPVPAGSLARPRAGEPTAVEVDPSNKPLPDGHAKTVVPRNPAHTERTLTPAENEMEAIRRDQAALNDRVAALSAKTGL